MTYRKGRWS